MEIVDIMDSMTPIFGDSKELIPPYIVNGHSGRTLWLNRTEDVRGSNPLRSTSYPTYVGDFALFDPTGGGIIPVQQVDDLL